MQDCRTRRNRGSISVSRSILAAGAILICQAAISLASAFSSSLELDESLTFWVINDGLGDVWHRAYFYQGQSPLYFGFLWIVRHFCGSGEAWLRMPSVIAWLLSIALSYRIAQLAWGHDSALMAAAIFAICQRELFAFRARPYSVAIALLLAATYALVLWLRGGRARWLILYVAAMVVTFYVHYLYSGAISGHLALVAMQREGRRRIWSFLGAVGAFAAAALPGAIQLAQLARRAGQLSWAPFPEFADLLGAWMNPYVVLVPCTALLVTRLVCGGFPARLRPLLEGERAGLLAWYLAAPSIMYVGSLYSGAALLVDRYFLWGLPPGLLVAASLAELCDRRLRALFCGSALALGLAIAAGLGVSSTRYSWDEAAARVRSTLGQRPGGVLLLAGLVESNAPEFYASVERRQYLTAPFQYYELPYELIPLPPSTEAPSMRAYVRTEIDALARRCLPIALVVSVFQEPLSWELDRAYRRIVLERPYREAAHYPLGSVVVTSFEPQAGCQPT